MSYDFNDFLSSIKYLDRKDILDIAYKQHKALDKTITNLDKNDRLSLQNNVQGLLFWMETNQRPPNMSTLDFAKLKPLCENLIKKGQLEPEAIELFHQN